jgi:RNA 2',3'-cyclic 3'-phosphodiesterase
MSRGASARLFAAIDPPVGVGEQLLRWARAALRGAGERGPRLLEPESMHVTLIFLGERPFEEIDALADALGATAEQARACELETGAPIWLPPRRPRALAVEVRDEQGELADLQRRLSAALCAVAEVPVPRRFRAHLTLARARSAAAPGEALPPTPALRFTAEEVVLYRSHLEPRGARYERLAAAPLAG